MAKALRRQGVKAAFGAIVVTVCCFPTSAIIRPPWLQPVAWTLTPLRIFMLK